MAAIIGPPIVLDTPRLKLDAVWNLFAVVAAFSPPAWFSTYFARFTGVPGGNVGRAGILLLGVVGNAFLWGGTADLVRWSWQRKRWVAYIVMGVIALWFTMVFLPGLAYWSMKRER
jgi:hypothetical protein